MYNLLLVDDEPLIKVAFQSAVEWGKNGFLLAATASNGQEALHIVETQHIDAVITDLKMPGMDGLALIHELKKRSFIGPILVLSNYSDFDFVRTALTDGAYDYFRFLYKGIIIKHNKTEPTYTKTSLFLCEKRRFFMARTEKGVVATI